VIGAEALKRHRVACIDGGPEGAGVCRSAKRTHSEHRAKLRIVLFPNALVFAKWRHSCSSYSGAVYESDAIPRMS
jgi:hypothetical protein